MRVLVTGDREFEGDGVDRLMDELVVDYGAAEVVIIHGDCRGADRCAAEAAKLRGMEVVPFPADWRRYGGGAGPIRNRQMLDEGKPDVVFAFHPNLAASKGTLDMVRQALKAGLPVTLFNGRRDETDGREVSRAGLEAAGLWK